MLVVDGDRSTRSLLVDSLRVEGIAAATAADAHAALRQIVDDPPALVVVDVDSPWVEGWRLVEQIADVERFADVQVVALAGSTTDERLARGGRLGVAASVSRPFDVADVMDLVHELLGG